MELKKIDINVFSKSDNIRLYVIEHSIEVETLMSETIGFLLGINYKKSKSFGFNSASLSFNQKVNILTDINGIDSEMAQKLDCLMNIRNKFAHVKDINSFNNYFELTSKGKEFKNKLDKWYQIMHKKEKDEAYKFRFFKLASDITLMLQDLEQKNRVNKLIESGEKVLNEILISKIISTK